MIHFEQLELQDIPSVAKAVIEFSEIHPVVLFEGEMGAGKTTLISEILRQLGIEPEGSPTYGIVKTYFSEELGEVYHFDAYRIESEREAFDAGLEELIESGNLCFIEWPDKISSMLPNSFIFVKIGFDEQNMRFVDVIVEN